MSIPLAQSLRFIKKMSAKYKLPEFVDSRGRLTFVEEVTHLPFEIAEIYLLAGDAIPQNLSLAAQAFLMAPVGCVSVESDHLSNGITGGLLTDSHAELSLSATPESKLLILSAKPIPTLLPLKLPFRARRAYFMTDIPAGKIRGNHAHLTTSQLIFSLNGTFDVVLDNGTTGKSVTVTSDCLPVEAQLGVWHTLENFSADALCMVLASELFNPDDYISDYPEFLEIVNSSRKND